MKSRPRRRPNLYHSIEIAITYFPRRCGAFNNPQIKGKPRRARDTNGTRHCHYYTRVSWCIGAVYLLGRQVPNTMYQGGRNRPRGRRWGRGWRERGVPERYPRVTGHTARFKRVGTVSMKAAGITKAIREHYPESSVATLAPSTKNGPGLISDAHYRVNTRGKGGHASLPCLSKRASFLSLSCVIKCITYYFIPTLKT